MPKQQAEIYRIIEAKGQITSAEVEELLDVKERRARAILKTMVDNGVIKKLGAAGNTKYILMER